MLSWVNIQIATFVREREREREREKKSLIIYDFLLSNAVANFCHCISHPYSSFLTL